jgi:hypothetical protein
MALINIPTYVEQRYLKINTKKVIGKYNGMNFQSFRPGSFISEPFYKRSLFVNCFLLTIHILRRIRLKKDKLATRHRLQLIK